MIQTTKRVLKVGAVIAIATIVAACTSDPARVQIQQLLSGQIPQSISQQTPQVGGTQISGISRTVNNPPQQSNNEYSQLSPSTTTKQSISPTPTYKGPHRYSVERNGMYGYTSNETGEVLFFRYDGKQDENYKLVSFVGASYAQMITCKGDCKFADIANEWGVRTFQVKKGTVLESVIADMLAGALRSSR